MAMHEGLKAHLADGITHLARAWEITRGDGLRQGFTDHDRDLVFDGLVFRADTGLSALAVAQSTGLSVDNTEALGALSDAAITEADIAAGRYDGAQVTAWVVNWDLPAERQVIFRGTIGEIARAGGAFRAELRGLSEALNVPVGRVFQKPCTAVLGDLSCGVDLSAPAFRHEGPVVTAEGNRRLVLDGMGTFAEGWFQRGRLRVLSGAAQGLQAAIKRDRLAAGGRQIELWEPLRATIAPGDLLRLEAGCDKRFATCRDKFVNLLNFQGFPDIPEEDWMMVHPTATTSLGGGSRR